MEQEQPIVAIKNQIATLVEGAELISVTSKAEYEALMRQENMAYAFKKQVEDYFGPDIKKAHELHKSLTSKRGEIIKPIETFLGVCRSVGGAFLALEQRREQKRLDALRKQAEEMRREQEAKIAAEAEALRVKQEAERKAQEIAFKNSPAELARAKARMEAERLAAEAELQRKRDSVIDTSMMPTEAAKVSAGEGKATVQTWTYDIVDENAIPRQFMTPNLVAIKAMVTAMKDKCNIPGVKVRMETSVRRTGR